MIQPLSVTNPRNKGDFSMQLINKTFSHLLSTKIQTKAHPPTCPSLAIFVSMCLVHRPPKTLKKVNDHAEEDPEGPLEPCCRSTQSTHHVLSCTFNRLPEGSWSSLDRHHRSSLGNRPDRMHRCVSAWACQTPRASIRPILEDGFILQGLGTGHLRAVHSMGWIWIMNQTERWTYSKPGIQHHRSSRIMAHGARPGLCFRVSDFKPYHWQR